MISETKKISVVLAGFESSGKSAIFRGLTGSRSGDENNFKGSTVVCRKCEINDCGCEIVDTPGIRVASDSRATKLAVQQIGAADVVLLVTRGTHARSELKKIFSELGSQIHGKKAVLAVTFKDKASLGLPVWIQAIRKKLRIPVVALNARKFAPGQRQELLDAVNQAQPLSASASWEGESSFEETHAPETILERGFWGKGVALLGTLLFYLIPVWAAYHFSSWIQPFADRVVITPLLEAAAQWPEILRVLLCGSYGVLTLGWYSFLWAFPVVSGVGLSTAILAETGLKDRMTETLDPWLRKIGMSGRDLIPILSGFGCNVVAVHQSRACSACSRKSCVSMISFASACSYQIGAALSVFGASGRGGLLLPYLAVLFVVGAVHTRIWYGRAARQTDLDPMTARAFLQKPSMAAVGWHFKSALKQFLFQAMPIFLWICLAAAFLQMTGFMDYLAKVFSPVSALFHLPAAVVPALIFSFFRKDGLLILNQSDGALLSELSGGQIFLTVYLASTLSACLVTLWTAGKELGAGYAFKMAGRQFLTSALSAWLMSLGMKFISG